MMTKRRFLRGWCAWQHWRIRTRILLVALLPLSLLGAAMLIYSSYTRLAQGQEELAERGRMLAFTLAENSEYAVASADFKYVAHTVDSLLRDDPSIVQIELLDPAQQVLFKRIRHADASDDSSHRLVRFRAPIQARLAQFNSFDEQAALPHVSAAYPSALAPSPLRGRMLGTVIVTLSSAALLAKQQRKIAVEAALIVLALALSMLFGLYLALSLTRPLANTLYAVRALRAGDYTTSLVVESGGEIGDLQTAIVAMAASLYEFKTNLEGQVASRTQALAAARDAALQADAEKRRLIQKVHSAIETERKQIAAELHDELNAILIVLRLEAQGILAWLEPDRRSALTQTAFAEIRNKTQTIITQSATLYALCRQIVQRLRPEIIEMLGVQEAVADMLAQYTRLHQDCRFSLDCVGDFARLSPDLALTIYRLVQEALSNVIKHAQATQVQVSLQLDDECVLITVQDNGCGFDLAQMQAGLGLLGMRERADSLGGTLRIITHPGAGTRLEIGGLRI